MDMEVTMDGWNGTPYDDDPAQWQKLDPAVVRFETVDVNTEQAARLIAEARNPGFQPVGVRPEGFAHRVELWKVRT